VVMRNQRSPMGQGKSDEHPPYEELTRRCDRLVPPVVELVVLCELVLPQGMPQAMGEVAAVSPVAFFGDSASCWFLRLRFHAWMASRAWVRQR
ncbi:hypothetical protein Taro_027351, partial [Colocasia esculenta]|nr:hypothetical protein [Colocasia esculenta]